MPETVKFTIPRNKDDELVRRLKEAVGTLYPVAGTVAGLVSGASIDEPGSDHPRLQPFLELGTISIRTLTFRLDNQEHTIRVSRGPEGEQNWHLIHTPR